MGSSCLKSASEIQPSPTIIFLILSSFGFVQGEASRSVGPRMVLLLVPVGLDGKG